MANEHLTPEARAALERARAQGNAGVQAPIYSNAPPSTVAIDADEELAQSLAACIAALTEDRVMLDRAIKILEERLAKLRP